MHKENIFDLFNKQNPPSKNGTLNEVVFTSDVTEDIIPNETNETTVTKEPETTPDASAPSDTTEKGVNEENGL